MGYRNYNEDEFEEDYDPSVKLDIMGGLSDLGKWLNLIPKTADDYYKKIEATWVNITNNVNNRFYANIPTDIQKLKDGLLTEALTKYPKDANLLYIKKALDSIRDSTLQRSIETLKKDPNDVDLKTATIEYLNSIWIKVKNNTYTTDDVGRESIKDKVARVGKVIVNLQAQKQAVVDDLDNLYIMIESIKNEYKRDMTATQKKHLVSLQVEVERITKNEVSRYNFIKPYNVIVGILGYTPFVAKSYIGYSSYKNAYKADIVDREINEQINNVIEEIKSIDKKLASMARALRAVDADISLLASEAIKKDKRSSSIIKDATATLAGYIAKMLKGTYIKEYFQANASFLQSFGFDPAKFKSIKVGALGSPYGGADELDVNADMEQDVIAEGVRNYLLVYLPEALLKKDKGDIINTLSEFNSLYGNKQEIVDFIYRLKSLVNKYV